MSLSSSLRPSRSSHFEYSTNVSLSPSRPECDVYLLLVLPPDVFLDKYELNERGIIYTLHGDSNLEFPLAAADPAGTTLEVRVPLSLRVDIPLHTRYPLPNPSPYSRVRVSEPQGFWACPTPNKSKDNPFSHISAPYVPSFDSGSWTITFFDTSQGERYHEIQVPTGRPADMIVVDLGTVFAVTIAFFYVAWAVWKTAMRLRVPTEMKRE